MSSNLLLDIMGISETGTFESKYKERIHTTNFSSFKNFLLWRFVCMVDGIVISGKVLNPWLCCVEMYWENRWVNFTMVNWAITSISLYVHHRCIEMFHIGSVLHSPHNSDDGHFILKLQVIPTISYSKVLRILLCEMWEIQSCERSRDRDDSETFETNEHFWF